MKEKGIYTTVDKTVVMVAPNSTQLNPFALSRPLLSSSADSHKLNDIISTCPMFASSHWMSKIYENPEQSAALMKEYFNESLKVNGDSVYTNGAQIVLPYIAMIHEILSNELQRDTSMSFSWNNPPDNSFLLKTGNKSY